MAKKEKSKKLKFSQEQYDIKIQIPKIRLVKPKSPHCLDKVWRPKTFDEYVFLVNELDKEYQYTDLNSIDYLYMYSERAFLLALELILDVSRINENKLPASFLSSSIYINKKTVPWEVGQIWFFDFIRLREHWQHMCDYGWNPEGPAPDFYDNTSWPQDPKSIVFYASGWSALEAMNRFTAGIVDLSEAALSWVRRIDWSDKAESRRLESEIKFEPKVTKAAIELMQHLKETLENRLPSSEWPNSIIERERNCTLSKVRYEYEQVKVVTEKPARTGQTTKPAENDDLITLTEAAGILFVDKGTVSRLANKGVIMDNGIKGPGRKVSKISVLMLKEKREQENRRADYEELKRDADNIPDMH